MGRWAESSVFVVTLVDTSGHEVPADVTKGGVSVIGDLKNENELSRWCKATAGFSGNVGSAEAPQITRSNPNPNPNPKPYPYP